MNQIKSRRIKSGYTQSQVAAQLHVGQSTVAMWETGSAFPRADKLPDLARILGCTINDLFEEALPPAASE